MLSVPFITKTKTISMRKDKDGRLPDSHNTCDVTGIYAPVQYLHNSGGVNETTCLLVHYVHICIVTKARLGNVPIT